MISMTIRAGTGLRAARLRNWRVIAGLAGVAAGITIVTGAFLPWVETFAGLIGIPGIRGGNGRILAAGGLLIAGAGLYHVIRGGSRSRWLTGLGGFAALGFSGYLLIQLAATMRALGGDSMVLARGGPGLWITAAGSLLAFGTLFLPSAPATVPANRQVPSPARSTRADSIRQVIMGRTADLESAGVRRGLQIALGLAWLTDAALQFQPYMFGSAFATHMLAPASAGNPAVFASPVLWASRLIGHDVPAWNTMFAIVQLAIAAGLLWRPAVKAALAGSVVWALAVWWLGEGLGGVLTGTATPLTGAPGAVILYALTAVLAWPRRSSAPGRGGLAAASPLGSHWSRAAWLALWGSFAYLILQPAVRAPRSLHDTLAQNAAGEPGWLAALDRGAASAAGSHGLAISVLLAVVFAVIAAGILVPATTRPVLALAIVVGLAIWIVGENLGGMLTGMATDPNTGPLLILLAAAYWPRPRAPHRDSEPLATVLAGQGGNGDPTWAGQAADRRRR
jgi:hypothetical protein